MNLASLRENNAKKFAVKSIPRKLIDKYGKEKRQRLATQFNEDNPELEEGFDDEEYMQELLETEIKVLLNMDHPNIVKFHSCVYDNDYINIVMELVRGESLADYLIKKRKLSEQDTKFIMYDICCATKYFHEKGIVHRDLKLLNVLLTGVKHENCS